MKEILKEYHIKSPVKDVWDALINPETIEKWGGGPVEMDEKVGTKFKLWGGDIFGTNTEVIHEKKLVQDWYGGDWPEPSKLVFELISEKDGTLLKLTQKGVPEDEEEDIDSGWDDYYLGAIKEYLESR